MRKYPATILVTGICVACFTFSMFQSASLRIAVLWLYPMIVPSILLVALLVMTLRMFAYRNILGSRALQEKCLRLRCRLTQSAARLLVPKLSAAGKGHLRLFLRALMYACAIILFLLPVFSAWHSAESYGTVLGIFPSTDGPSYYQGAKELLYTGRFETFASRRPLSTAFFAVRLALARHNYQWAVLLQAAILGMCCICTARIIVADFGRLTGTLFLSLLFLVGERYVANPLTEALGLSLGALAFGVLWHAARSRSKWTFSFGLLMLTTALNARAGTFFVLPALVLWAGMFLTKSTKRWQWRTAGVVSLGVVAGLLVQFAVTKLYTGSASVGQDNFKYLLYSATRGDTGWKSHLSLPEADRTDLYEKSWQEIKKRPANLLVGLAKRISRFAKYGVYAAPLVPIRNNVPRILFAPFCGVMLLGFASFLWKNRMRREVWMIALAGAGYLLSGFIIGDTGKRRVVVATIPFLLLGFAFASTAWSQHCRGWLARKGVMIKTVWPALTLSCILIFSLLAGPAVGHLFEEIRPVSRVRVAGDDDVLVIRGDMGLPHISVVRDLPTKEIFIPRIGILQYRKGCQEAYPGSGFKHLETTVEAPWTIALACRLNGTGAISLVYVVGHEDMFNQSTRLVALSGEYGQFPGGDAFFVADEAKPFSISETVEWQHKGDLDDE